MSLLVQTQTLARRSIRTTFRQPAVVASVLFPLLFMFVTTSGAGSIADVPGFGKAASCARSCPYLDFYLAGALVQGTLFAGVGSGAALATDIEEGFIRRLLLTPLIRPAILIGLAGGAMVIGVFQGALILVAGLIGGVRIEGGIAGAIVVLALAVFVALAFSSIGALVAARTGSSEATQTVFPLFFILIIFSSYFMPRPFLSGWFKALATYNPATYIIEALRSPIVHGWDARALGLGIAAVTGLCVVGFGGAAAALRTRLARV